MAMCLASRMQSSDKILFGWSYLEPTPQRNWGEIAEGAYGFAPMCPASPVELNIAMR